MRKLYKKLHRKAKSIQCSLYRILFFFTVISLLYIFLLKSFYREEIDNYPVVIWWDSGFSNKNKFPCKHKCKFTHDRSLKDDPHVEGYLFYGSEFNIFDLPLPRDGVKKIWALLHEESPRNTPILSHDSALNLFNYSSTISRYSDIPLTLQYLDNINELLDDKHYIDTNKKNNLLRTLSPILYIQSDCETSSYRDHYVKELMKYIPIDSYGICLNNKELPEEFHNDYLNKLYDDDFLDFVSKYKFTIAIENGICEDYITEKLWRPLRVGSVPIYMGSPSVRDWLPNERSAIIMNDFESMERLAAYINHLNEHDDEYEEYLQHKTKKKINNTRLVEALENRNYNFINDDVKQLYVDAFKCFLCEKIYERRNGGLKESIVTKKQYDCVKPKPPIVNADTFWSEQWNDSFMTAKLLYKFVILENKDSVIEAEFENEFEKMKTLTFH